MSSLSSITLLIKSRRMKRMGQVALCGREGAYRILVRKPKERRILKKTNRRREDDIRIDIQSIGWGRCVLNLEK